MCILKRYHHNANGKLQKLKELLLLSVYKLNLIIVQLLLFYHDEKNNY